MTAPLETSDQVRQYIEEVLPTERTFHIGRMPVGAWLLQPLTTPQERDSGAAIGLTTLVVIPDSGVVLEYPSWPGNKVMDDYTRSVREGTPPRARQIHPPQHRIDLQLIRENPDRIEYRMIATSPLHPTIEYAVEIRKQPLSYTPVNTDVTMAVAWAHWKQEQDGGTWPSTGTTWY